ncbi:hypothetical protein EV685_1149 [Sphaerotilus mobilis]|uniref:Uncharacterized protein n=1 Tax=Sphaerotilus mobilis TaxID=47994 RepID=A0A4V2EWN4_9BURK|nr:hypothetical protein EV685_1149 [Sphaerotilus mobilis]
MRGMTGMTGMTGMNQRAERRAAPKPARIPTGDRPVHPRDEGST